MLISSIETFASEYVTLVRVRTDDGDEGQTHERNASMPGGPRPASRGAKFI